MAEHITAAKRHSLPKSDFADPSHEAYPVDTPGRARSALSRGAHFAPPGLMAKIRAKVHRKFPGIKQHDEHRARGGQAVHGRHTKHRLDRHR
jgi:hypothetical protein